VVEGFGRKKGSDKGRKGTTTGRKSSRTHVKRCKEFSNIALELEFEGSNYQSLSCQS